MSSALIPHPAEYSGYVEVELIDELVATRLAAAYDDGCYMAIERIFNPTREYRTETFRQMDVLHDAYAPRYTEVRDFLIGEFNVPRVLAARIALRMTRGRP